MRVQGRRCARPCSGCAGECVPCVRGCGDQHSHPNVLRGIARRRNRRPPVCLHELAAVLPLELRVADVGVLTRTAARFADLAGHVAEVARADEWLGRQRDESRGGEHNQEPSAKRAHGDDFLYHRQALPGLPPWQSALSSAVPGPQCAGVQRRPAHHDHFSMAHSPVRTHPEVGS